jgi:2-polyprenyl-6-methoxyphenol hydroxylase-like FAD-dependent oxidoreductase
MQQWQLHHQPWPTPGGADECACVQLQQPPIVPGVIAAKPLSTINSMKRFDVCVRGAGVVGQSLALSLARQGLQVALVPDAAAAAGSVDVRAYALSAASVALLRGLKVWDALPAHAATAVHEMRIEGDAPQGRLAFTAWQQQVAELSWIVDAAVLEHALASAVRYAPHITVTPEAPPAELLALCEGKASASRDALGVVFERHDYGHRAIATRLTTPLPHRHIAHQWFRSPDVLALLPLDTPQPGHAYALVWSLPEALAQDRLALSDADFEAALSDATQGLCGPLALASPRASWPLMRAEAQAWCGPGWVLLGDAAHVVHPLAGQGLNLGLADVAALSEVIAQREAWRAVGDERLLRRYTRRRLLPTRAMGNLTGGLLHLFSDDSAPVRALRNRGMAVVDRLAPIKRWLTDRALNS